jgi:chemotaxis methyl-accepting protein methylase
MVTMSQLEQLRQTAEAETGMDLAGTRFPRLQAAVERLLAQRPGADLERILAHADKHAAFLESLTVELTVGESFFLRNEHHMRALREQVFPEILRDNADRREVRIWSAGCATGEEPYSLAILLDQLLAERGPWQVSILGTDLNLTFLERARQARYRQWSFRQTEVQQDRRYFSVDGEWFALAPRIRSADTRQRRADERGVATPKRSGFLLISASRRRYPQMRGIASNPNSGTDDERCRL